MVLIFGTLPGNPEVVLIFGVVLILGLVLISGVEVYAKPEQQAPYLMCNSVIPSPDRGRTHSI